jgi:hypothetical protein
MGKRRFLNIFTVENFERKKKEFPSVHIYTVIRTVVSKIQSEMLSYT